MSENHPVTIVPTRKGLRIVDAATRAPLKIHIALGNDAAHPIKSAHCDHRCRAFEKGKRPCRGIQFVSVEGILRQNHYQDAPPIKPQKTCRALRAKTTRIPSSVIST